MHKAAVIIPVYKNDKLEIFKKSIDSIFAQTYTNYDLFIAIDGPLDDEVSDYIHKLENQGVNVLEYKENRGLAAVLNSAIQFCKGQNYEYIVRMDADDISLPRRLEKQIGYLETNHEISVLGTQAFIIDADDNVYGEKHASPSISYNVLRKKCDIIHPSVIFRTSFFDIIGYYNEDAILAEDYDLWFRAVRKNINIVSIKDRLLYFRFDINNIKRRKKAQKEIIKVKLKYLKIFDYIFILSHFLVMLSPNFLLKFIINHSIRFNEEK